MFSTAGRHRHDGQVGCQLLDGRHGGDDRARAGLVHLHLVHPVGRLDADAAGVEADALAHHRQQPALRVGGPRLTVAQDDEARLVGRALADGEEHAHAQRLGLLGAQHLDLEAVPCRERRRLVREHLGADVVRRALREPAGEVAALADDAAALRGAAEGIRVARADHEDQLIERGRPCPIRLVDATRVLAPLHHAAGDELHRPRGIEVAAQQLRGDHDRERAHRSLRQPALDGRTQAGARSACRSPRRRPRPWPAATAPPSRRSAAASSVQGDPLSSPSVRYAVSAPPRRRSISTIGGLSVSSLTMGMAITSAATSHGCPTSTRVCICS